MHTLLRIFAYGVRYPWRAAATFGLAVLSTVLVLVLPAVTKVFIDEVIPKAQPERVLPLALLGVGAIALRQVVAVLRGLANNAFEQRIIHDLRMELYGRIQRLPLRWFDRQPTGDIMHRMASDVPAIERVVVGTIDQGLSGFLQFTAVMAYLLWLDWGLALLTVAPLPLVALTMRVYQRHAEPRFKAVSEANSALQSVLHDNVAGIRQIKGYTVEPEELRRFESMSGEAVRAQKKAMRIGALAWPLVSLTAETGIVLSIAFGAWWILEGKTTLGALSAVLMSWGLLYDPISRVSPLVQTFVTGIVSGRRVFGILDLAEEPNLTEGLRPDRLEGRIRYEGVTFSYSGAEGAPQVRGIDLEVEPGQTAAFVGPTGAGKSTLLNLLTRFYEVSEGRITIDGIPLEQLSKEWLRDRIGYVTQESFLFNMSIRDNLLLGRPEATDEEIWDALRAANAEDFVRRLEGGLDTTPGERGVQLSGGERQRLAIARALLKNPPVLLLDEATSAVDNETERLIQQALERLRSQRTVLVIAHRLTTVQSADCIYVMENGGIVERGDHKSLLARGGAYARLCEAGLREEGSDSAERAATASGLRRD